MKKIAILSLVIFNSFICFSQEINIPIFISDTIFNNKEISISTKYNFYFECLKDSNNLIKKVLPMGGISRKDLILLDELKTVVPDYLVKSFTISIPKGEDFFDFKSSNSKFNENIRKFLSKCDGNKIYFENVSLIKNGIELKIPRGFFIYVY